MPTTSPRLTFLTQEEQHNHAIRHHHAVSQYTQGFLDRRQAGRKHPVEDFLFTYYSFKPGQLTRWHPGIGTVLQAAGDTAQANWRFYEHVEDGTEAGGLTVDVDSFSAERSSIIDFARRLLSTTSEQPAQLGCFGLHEWAMVYRSQLHGQRHDHVPLRLGARGTDEVVESLKITCTHFDAFRFYTPSAEPLNTLQPRRDNQVTMEQPGCLHANMDLYKWAYKLIPAVSSDLLLDCFDLAWRIRELDMRASPYDLQDWGYDPVRIEEPAGRAEYTRAQRGFSEESQALRRRLLNVLERLPAAPPA